MLDKLKEHTYTMTRTTYEQVRRIASNALDEHVSALDVTRFKSEDLRDLNTQASVLVRRSFTQVLKRSAKLETAAFRALAVRLYVVGLAKRVPAAFRLMTTARHIASVQDGPAHATPRVELGYLLTSLAQAHVADKVEVKLLVSAITGSADFTAKSDPYPRLARIDSQDWTDGEQTFFKPSLIHAIDLLALGDAEDIARSLRNAEHGSTTIGHEALRSGFSPLIVSTRALCGSGLANLYADKVIEHLLAFLPENLKRTTEGGLLGLSSDLMRSLRHVVRHEPAIDEDTRSSLMTSLCFVLTPHPGFESKCRAARDIETARSAAQFLRAILPAPQPRR